MTDARIPVVTGYGAVGHWGSGLDGLWELLVACQPGGRWWMPDDGARERFAAPLPEEYRPHPEIPRSIRAALDRGTAIALDAALQAVAMAGLGQGGGDARRFALCDALPVRAPGQPGLYVPYGHTVARAFGIRGPVECVAGGEASAALAIARAAQLVAEGTVDVAIAGGAQALQQPLLEHLGQLGAAEEPARPFDRRSRGFVPGEGAGYLVIEASTHAAERDARVVATLAGAGITFDPSAEPLEYSDPSETGRAVQAALAAAGYLQGQVDVVVSGADGRRARDNTEAYAIRRVFGRHSVYATVTAPAAALGNTLGASAVLATITALECMRRQSVPPIAGLEEPEEGLELPFARAVRDERIDVALVTAFGLGGTNAALLLARAQGDRP